VRPPDPLLSIMIFRQEFVIFRTSSFSMATIASGWTRRNSVTPSA